MTLLVVVLLTIIVGHASRRPRRSPHWLLGDVNAASARTKDSPAAQFTDRTHTTLPRNPGDWYWWRMYLPFTGSFASRARFWCWP
jgi:hypothetical protein